MKLSGRQRQELHGALLDAFPTRNALQRLMAFGLDERLDEIAGDGGLSDTMFEVITWAEATGREEELMIKAREANPGNARLNTVIGKLLTAVLTAPDPPEAPVSPLAQSTATTSAGRGPSKAALRKAMAQSFDSHELDLLAADIQDALQERGIDQPVSLAIVGAEGVSLETQVLRLIDFLDRRRQLDVLIDAVRRARPGLLS